MFVIKGSGALLHDFDTDDRIEIHSSAFEGLTRDKMFVENLVVISALRYKTDTNPLGYENILSLGSLGGTDWHVTPFDIDRYVTLI